jgi:hypothetical protein
MSQRRNCTPLMSAWAKSLRVEAMIDFFHSTE